MTYSVHLLGIAHLFSIGFNTPTLASSFPRKRESRTIDFRVRGSDKIPRCLRRGLFIVNQDYGELQGVLLKGLVWK